MNYTYDKTDIFDLAKCYNLSINDFYKYTKDKVEHYR